MRPLFTCFFIFFTNVAVAATSCFRRPSHSRTRAPLLNPSRHDSDLTAEVQTDGSIVIHNNTSATIHVAAIGFTSTAGHLVNPFMPPPNDAVREVAPFTHDGGYTMQPDSTEQLTALELDGSIPFPANSRVEIKFAVFTGPSADAPNDLHFQWGEANNETGPRTSSVTVAPNPN